ncbi:Importin subunit alpha-2 [Bienertia sinuspersici]
MGSSKSLEVLISLVKTIKWHLVNEMELNGQIPKIIGLLSSEDVNVRLMAMHCLFEMAYFGKKDVIESMIDCGFVEKLVFLQRVDEPKCYTSEVAQLQGIKNRGLCIDDELEREMSESSSNGSFFSGCIARFAVQVEVGEGMEKLEKKEIKMEILRRARAACVSEAEAATVVAEILWGSNP